MSQLVDRGRDYARGPDGCAGCGAPLTFARLEVHHVLERQLLRKKGVAQFDPDNALALGPCCHQGQTSRLRQLPLTCLRDENYEFAARALGAAGYDALRRRYSGDDPRLDALLALQS